MLREETPEVLTVAVYEAIVLAVLVSGEMVKEVTAEVICTVVETPSAIKT